MSWGPRMPAWAKLVITPSVEIRPIELPRLLVNQSAPSGPEAIPSGPRMLVWVKGVRSPRVEIRPIVLFPGWVNQSALSGPAAIPLGCETGATKIVIDTLGSAAATASAALRGAPDSAPLSGAAGTGASRGALASVRSIREEQA